MSTIMRIVELSEYTMVIMKDSDDPPWVNLGDIYRRVVTYNFPIFVDVGNQMTVDYISAREYVYTAGRLILYFEQKIPDRFHLHDKVTVTD